MADFTCCSLTPADLNFCCASGRERKVLSVSRLCWRARLALMICCCNSARFTTCASAKRLGGTAKTVARTQAVTILRHCRSRETIVSILLIQIGQRDKMGDSEIIRGLLVQRVLPR